jgi:four helix bundle protein
MAARNYRDLLAWQKAMDLVDRVYRASQRFPPEEKFGLTNQLRRAAVSIPSNIAEGQGRRTAGDFIRFLSIAHGSLREVETQVMIARRQMFMSAEDEESLLDTAAEVGRLIQGLMNKLSAVG